MRSLLRSRPTVVWILLVAATVCSLALFELSEAADERRLVSVSVLAIAAVKVRFIGLDFMEVRHAPLVLRIAFEVWLLAITVALIALYWLQSAVPVLAS
ncbi:MAG TPA: cytochrome C oxidase subunit IV family protein [Steroidobacteraceae bacterium]|nr:cytochrome C oxidase subunit IV family protein [Steroidobacteraceae bacterium]